MDYVNFHHLIHFYHVANCGSYTKAAEELKISQPTLSEQIKSLEQCVGKTLFVRKGRDIQLTATGDFVFMFAKDIFESGNQLIHSINTGACDDVKRLRIGVMNSIPKLIVSHILKLILAINNKVTVEFQEHESSLLKSMLTAKKLDLIIGDDPALGNYEDQYLNFDIGVSPAAIFKSKKNKKKYLNLPEDLNDENFIMQIQGSFFRSQIDLWFFKNKITPRIAVEIADTALIKVLGEENVGLFISPIYLATEIEEKFRCEKIFEIKDLVQQFFLTTNESHYEKKIIKDLIDSAVTNSIFQ